MLALQVQTKAFFLLTQILHLTGPFKLLALIFFCFPDKRHLHRAAAMTGSARQGRVPQTRVHLPTEGGRELAAPRSSVGKGMDSADFSPIFFSISRASTAGTHTHTRARTHMHISTKGLWESRFYIAPVFTLLCHHRGNANATQTPNI